MYRKIHLKLTIVFTLVCSLILIVMSTLYLYMSENNLKNGVRRNFQNDMDTFITNFENSTIITYDWLSKLESNGRYGFYIYDNHTPFRFVTDTKSPENIKLVQEILAYYHKHYDKDESMSGFASYHTEFEYPDEPSLFCVGVGIIPGQTSNLEIVVLYSGKDIQLQIKRLYMEFIGIIIITILSIFIFSWYYTKRLLKPLEENQQKQVLFISAASHELRTPVATLLSALYAMDKGNEEEKKEFAGIAKKEGERLSLLVNDMLSLARSDNHTFSVHMENTEPDTLVIDTYEAFLAPAREKNITLSVSLPDKKVLHRKLDAERMKQVLAILMNNAISYSDSGSTVTLSYQETPKEICFSIIDNGPGIAQADKPYVFDRFYRAESARNLKEHFGLGLSIAKEIVEAHKGSIRLQDNPSGGCIFTVSIPK